MKKDVFRAALAAAAVSMLAGVGCSTTVKAAKPATTTSWVAPGLKVVSSPTAADHEFFVTAQDPGGKLEGTAVDATTGKVLWQDRTVPADRIAGVGLPSPVPVKTARGWTVSQVESNGGQIALGLPYAYVGRDPRTGRELWRYPVVDTTESMPCGTLLCLDVLNASGTATLIAVDPTTGKKAWSMPIDTQFTFVDFSSTTAFIQTLGVGTTVMAVDEKSGHKKWSVAVAKGLGAGVTTDSGWNGGLVGTALMIDADSDGTSPSGTIALDAATGKLLWAKPNMHFPIGMLNVLVSSGSNATPATAAAKVNNVVLEHSTFSSTSYDLVSYMSFDVTSGKVRWTVPENHKIVTKGLVPHSVVNDSLTDVWPFMANHVLLDGFAVATGKAVPKTGSGWEIQLAKGDGAQGQIAVPGQPDPYSPPVAAEHVSLPALTALAGGVPPASVSATATGTRAWVASDLRLHAVAVP